MALSVAGLYIYLAEIFKRKKTEPPLNYAKTKRKTFEFFRFVYICEGEGVKYQCTEVQLI